MYQQCLQFILFLLSVEAILSDLSTDVIIFFEVAMISTANSNCVHSSIHVCSFTYSVLSIIHLLILLWQYITVGSLFLSLLLLFLYSLYDLVFDKEDFNISAVNTINISLMFVLVRIVNGLIDGQAHDWYNYGYYGNYYWIPFVFPCAMTSEVVTSILVRLWVSFGQNACANFSKFSKYC